MKRLLIILLCAVTIIGLSGCDGSGASPSPSPSAGQESPSPSPSPSPKTILNPEGATLEERFDTPLGFTRTPQTEDSFGSYLRALPLKADGSSAHLFDGTAVPGAAPAAVFDLDVGARDNCQNTDVLLKIRAEYLYSRERYSEIAFHFMSGFNFTYETWAEGNTIKVDNSKVDWVSSGDPDNSPQSLDKYLHMLYAYSNATAILSDLQSAADPTLGDVFTEGGGVMIVDMAENAETGETIVMLCAGGSPAQSIRLLANTREPLISPWFTVSDGGVVYTDAGSFVMSALMRFK